MGAADSAMAPWAAINAWRRPATDNEPHPRRVLLFRLERIGDMLMTLPAISAIRARLPGAELRLVVGSWNAALARCMPAIDAVETFDVPWLSRERPGSTLRAAATQSAAWRRRGYDLAINFEPDIRSNALLAASGARRRAGYTSGGGGGLLTDALDYDRTIHSASNAQRLVDRILPVERHPPVDVGSNGAPFVIPRTAQEAADLLLVTHDGRGPLVGINPAAGRLVKEWPPERFAATAAAIAAATRATIVMLGAEGDRAKAGASSRRPGDRSRRPSPARRVGGRPGAAVPSDHRRHGAGPPGRHGRDAGRRHLRADRPHPLCAACVSGGRACGPVVPPVRSAAPPARTVRPRRS